MMADETEKFIGVIKIKSAKAYGKPLPDRKYVIGSYSLGTFVELESCDRYDWCKVSNQELYISKAALGTMYVPAEAYDRNAPVYPKIEGNRSVEPEAKEEKKYEEIPDKQKVPQTKVASCIRLKHIDLDENDILNHDSQDELFKDYYSQCIDSNRLKAILNDISRFYIDAGYITTKPYLKEQDVLDGQLDISVLRGYIENIVNAETKESNWKIKTAFILQKGEILNLRDLETSLEMVNRVPSSNSRFEIMPGTSQGQSIVQIKENDALPYHLQLGVTGEQAINDNNPYLTALFSIDNLLNINDILSINYNGSKVQKDYQSNLGGEVNYSFPIGSYLMEYVWFMTTYDQAVLGINDTYSTNGETKGSTLRISKIIFRNQKNKLKLAGSLQYKDTKNYFSDVLIDVSSYKTTQFQVDLTHTYLQNWGQINTTYSFYKGTDWFGARKDSFFNSEIDNTSQAKLQFTKYTLDTNIFYAFLDRSYQINSNIHFQYSPDYLYDNNKLRIGSYYTVRGYSSSYYGNNGGYIKNDLSKTFYTDIAPYAFTAISPYVGIDYGRVQCQRDNENICGALVGSALGLKTSAEHVDTDFSWNKPLSKIDGLNLSTLFRFNINVKF
ncbi:MAG: POTRA domain-containing protein [Helicobacteraceae bacterium]|nr:POTRA domain-containing protein [Helicobacteraceae bacterium]